jgi:hypothetical protein
MKSKNARIKNNVRVFAILNFKVKHAFTGFHFCDFYPGLFRAFFSTKFHSDGGSLSWILAANGRLYHGSGTFG